MARTRLIKPDFFTDPDLADVSYQARIAFAGLWCHADRKGRLRHEPRKLKVLIFPFDKVSMEILLEELTQKPFIKIYEINGVSYIQIINWEKHQSPHNTEKASDIPEYNGDLTVKQPLLNKGDASAPFNIRYQDKVKNTSINIDTFDPLWEKYPNKDGRKQAQIHFKATVRTDQDLADINTALDNYLKSEKVKNGFIKNGSTWFNNWRDWITYKDPPVVLSTKQEAATQKVPDVDETQKYLQSMGLK